MINKIKYLLNVYLGFIEASFSQSTSFRINFFLLVGLDLIFYFVTLTSFQAILQHTQSIGPWEKEYILFFVSYMLVVDCLHMGMVSESFWELPALIRTGDIDLYIVRPAPILFSLFFRHFRPSTLITILFAVGIFIHHGKNVNLTALQWAIMPICLGLSTILFITVEIFISIFTFWAQEGLGINFLRMQITELSRYPDFIFNGFLKHFFTFIIPSLLVGPPAIYWIKNSDEFSFIFFQIILIIIFLLANHFLFRKALLKYESSSS